MATSPWVTMIGESLKILNTLLSLKVANGQIEEAKKDELMKEAKDAIARRDYDRFFLLLRRARRL